MPYIRYIIIYIIIYKKNEIKYIPIRFYINKLMISIRNLNIFSNHIKVLLGRWKIHNYKETSLKIKYANEDNCAFTYYSYKNIKKIHQNKNLIDDDKYIYMMGYESVQ